MSELKAYITEMLAAPVNKVVLSHPKSKSEAYKKISIVKKKDFYQIEKYTDKQIADAKADLHKTGDKMKKAGTYIEDDMKCCDGKSKK